MTRNARANAVAALVGYGLCLALLLFTVWLLTQNGVSGGTVSGQDVALALTCPAVGALIVARRPGNRIGQLLLLTGFGASAQVCSRQYAQYALHTRPGGLPGGVWALWVSDWVWVVGFSGVVLFLLLVFPTGHLPSGRWRPMAWFNVTIAAALLLVSAFGPGHMGDTATGPINPVGVAALAGIAPAVGAIFVLALASTLIRIGGLVARLRRARGVERAQLKWFVYAAAIAVVTLLGDGLSWLGSAGVVILLDWSSTIALGCVPIAIGIAVLRYRLYEIDRLVSRTLSYALITGLLVAIYAGLVTVVTRFTPTGNSLAVAGSTLAVAALFRPLRRRVQGAVDRRFNRARYDAGRTVESFSARLREQVDLASVQEDLLSVVQVTMQPTATRLWLRTDGRVAR